MPDLQRGVVPPGTYAGGKRSPIAYVYLCAVCAGFAPLTGPGYSGAMNGECDGCGDLARELHRFPALIDSAAGCNCRTSHDRVTGDLTPSLKLAEAAQRLAVQWREDSTNPYDASSVHAEALERVISEALKGDGGG